MILDLVSVSFGLQHELKTRAHRVTASQAGSQAARAGILEGGEAARESYTVTPSRCCRVWVTLPGARFDYRYWRIDRMHPSKLKSLMKNCGFGHSTTTTSRAHRALHVASVLTETLHELSVLLALLSGAFLQLDLRPETRARGGWRSVGKHRHRLPRETAATLRDPPMTAEPAAPAPAAPAQPRPRFIGAGFSRSQPPRPRGSPAAGLASVRADLMFCVLALLVFGHRVFVRSRSIRRSSATQSRAPARGRCARLGGGAEPYSPPRCSTMRRPAVERTACRSSLRSTRHPERRADRRFARPSGRGYAGAFRCGASSMRPATFHDLADSWDRSESPRCIVRRTYSRRDQSQLPSLRRIGHHPTPGSLDARSAVAARGLARLMSSVRFP